VLNCPGVLVSSEFFGAIYRQIASKVAPCL
jgi:hypothetical protein